MFHTPKCKIQNYKIIEDDVRKNQGDLGFDNDFQVATSKA